MAGAMQGDGNEALRLTLRPYQEECVAAHFDWFARNQEGHPLFVVPTGAGKSLIIAEFVRRSLEAWPGCRFIVPTHVKELVEQNYNEFVNHWGGILGCPAGIYSAGLGRRNTREKVLFCNIQSIWKRAEELGSFDLALVDEAHMIPKKGQGRYLSYFEDLREINPNLRACGYTATHYRLDGGYLHDGDGRLFTDVACEVKLEDLIPEFLVPLVAKAPKAGQIDLRGVRSAHGDYKMNELEAAALDGDCVEEAVHEIVRIGREQERKAWLIFATTVRHAELVCEFLQGQHDVDAACVFGDTPKDERRQVVNDFREGRLTALVNVGVLTTGFNAPRCDLMAILRPTQSTALYVQMMGRGMRTFSGKKDCLVLDYGGNVLRHGPINAVRPRKLGTGEAIMAKICPDCDQLCVLGALECDACGHLFMKPCPLCAEEVPLRTKTCEHCGYEFFTRHEGAAGTLDPFDPDAHKPKVRHVSSWHFREHHKQGKPDSIRVDYICGLKTYSEWVCPQHVGYAGRKADKWWTTHGGQSPLPTTAAEALARVGELRQPDAIEVVLENDFDRVKKTLFKKTQESA